jgi:hypothetical protein
MSERKALYDDMSPHHLTRSGNRCLPWIPCVPHTWACQDVLPFPMRAGELISAELD